VVKYEFCWIELG